MSMFILLLFVVMTTAAEDTSRRGCRRGTPRPMTVMSRGDEVPTQTHQAGGDFYKGERHQLVVLVSFKDLQFTGDEAATMERWDNVFNAKNYTEDHLVGSVHDYFYAQSCGQFDLQFDLLYIALNDSVRKYRSTPGDDGDDENSQYLVNDLVDVLQTYDIDWSKYDWNGDGFVNQLMIVYPGKGLNEDERLITIWPHQWWLSCHEKDRIPGEYCEPRKMTYDGKAYWIDCYCVLQEIANGKMFGSFGTICHEYTHCFGFPDFYSYYTDKTPRAWDLMDYGNNGGGGFCPPNYSAHERYLMGWLNLTELLKDTTVTNMPGLGDEPQAYLIRNDGYENEFYIVENRQQKGWDAQLPGSGIIVFHVDFDENIWTGFSGEYANSISKLRYHILPANNKTSYKYSDGWAYPYESNNSLTNTSEPADMLNHMNADGTYHMNKPLTNMQVTDGLASFDFMKDPSAIQAINCLSVVNGQWFDLQGRQLPGRPQHKGLYIVNGCKVVVR